MSIFTLNNNKDVNNLNISTTDKNNSISSKKDLLMESLIHFFSHKEKLDRIKPIINGNDTSKNKHKMSLRILDWFVTNYSKKYNITYQVKLNDKIKNFIVYLDYKSQLKAYSKKQFDPFCRRERILFFIDKFNGTENEPIRTTVGQLNFFRWAIMNNLFDYIDKNYDSIESDMNKLTKKTKKTKTIKNKTNNENYQNNSFIMSSENTNSDLTLSATKKINKHNITITVKFN